MWGEKKVHACDAIMPDDELLISQDDINGMGHTAAYRLTPERQLWVRVLEFAWEEMQDRPGKLLKWIETEDFRFICKAVGCRPGEAAKHIKVIYGRNKT